MDPCYPPSFSVVVLFFLLNQQCVQGVETLTYSITTMYAYLDKGKLFTQNASSCIFMDPSGFLARPSPLHLWSVAFDGCILYTRLKLCSSRYALFILWFWYRAVVSLVNTLTSGATLCCWTVSGRADEPVVRRADFITRSKVKRHN